MINYEILVESALLMTGLVILIKSSDYFTDAAEKIGIFFGIPSFIIGVTIVSLGTSLPELMSSIVGVLEGAPEIVIGDVVGSNITNIFLVLGIAALIGNKIKISYELIHVDLPLLVGSSFYILFISMDGVITFLEGIIGLVILGVYLIYTSKSSEKEKIEENIIDEIKEESKNKPKKTNLLLNILILIFCSVLIYAGAKLTVSSVVELSSMLGIGKDIIALTIIALGTSLPELVVSSVAAFKGKSDIAVGNVLGSNIFNAAGVVGFSAIFGRLPITETIQEFHIPMMVGATLLYFFITQDREITKWEGALLIVFYALFIGKTAGVM